jgi:hypothetical protein
MASPKDDLEELNQHVVALADRIADQRDVIDEFEKQGRDVSSLRSILAAIEQIFARHLERRRLFEDAPDLPSEPEQAPGRRAAP